MPVAKKLRMDGKVYPSARAAAQAIQAAGCYPKASGAGISLAISRGQRAYLGREVEWAADEKPGMSRRDVRHLLQWRGVDPPGQLRDVADGDGPLARAIGAALVLSRGKEWLTQMGPVSPA